MEINYNQIESKEFTDFFLKNIAPKLKQAEDIRKERIEKLKNASIICYSLYGMLVAFFLTSCWGTTPNAEQIKDTAFLFMITFVLASIWPYNIMDKYRKDMKAFLFPSLLKFIGEFKFSKKTLSAAEIDNFNMFSNFNRYDTDDTILGTHKGIDIGIYEVDLEKVTGSGKNKSTVKIFKGLLCKFSMNKNFNGQTVVLQEKGWLNKSHDKNLKNVKLEDPMFEKEFEVYADDQIESRYLLTTAFMQRLLDLKQKFSTNITCSFYKNALIVAIPCKPCMKTVFNRKDFSLLKLFAKGGRNFFELPWIFKSLQDIVYFKNIIAEILCILSVVDTLKLEQDIGM